MGAGWAVVLLSMGERILEKAAFMWGQGQRGLQKQLLYLQWDHPCLPQAAACLGPAVSHRLWLSWLDPDREGRTAKD